MRKALAVALEERSLRVDSMEPVTPSLEDVFMDVVERSGGAAV